MKNESEKQQFAARLKAFAMTLTKKTTFNNEWTVKGFIDVFEHIYTISSDTKVISKVLELQLFPEFLAFAKCFKYKIELTSHQNYYPDLTFISENDPSVKFAVDLKTTYRDEMCADFCRGFTLGSHGEYFIDRTSRKNIQYPYDEYSGHFCLGIIYTKSELDEDEETRIYSIKKLKKIPSVLHDFLFFAEEKWKIASDKSGSGNTANIGSIQYIEDIVNGNGVFAKAGEELFDEYWMNYGKINIMVEGKLNPIASFAKYLEYRGLPPDLNNPRTLRPRKK